MKTARKDAMTPRERLTAYFRGQDVDRIPCMPLVTDQAYSLLGGPLWRYYHSARLMAEAQLTAFETYQHDAVGAGPGLFGIAEALGTRLTFSDDSIPFVGQPILQDYDALDQLPRIDPARSGRLPVVLEALAILQDAVKDRATVGCSLGGPITTAAAVRGTEHLLRDLRRQPEQVHRLMRLAVDNILVFCDALAALGIKPSLSEPIASGTLVSHRHFVEFVKPYLTQCCQAVAKRHGSGPFLHICGNTAKIWGDMADCGATILSLDNQVDLGEAKAAVGSRACLAGNVSPYVLWNGNPQQIAAAVKDCLNKAWNSPKGYILSSGCGLTLGTPVANVLAFMDAARRLGRFPLEPDRFS